MERYQPVLKRVHIAKYERELKRRRYEMEIDKHECRIHNIRDLYEIYKGKERYVLRIIRESI